MYQEGDTGKWCATFVVDSKVGQMLELVKLRSHASEKVIIELDEIQEGMYLKVMSANTGNGWIPVSGAQELPVTWES